LTRIAGQRIRLIEKLIGSEVKAELLILFHSNPELVASLDDLAQRMGRPSKEIRKEIDEFVRIGLINENPVYSLNRERDRQIQEAISRQFMRDSPGGEEEAEPPERRRTGIGVLDRLLPEGCPHSASILVLGDPGSNRTILCQQFLAESMKAGLLCIYVCCEDFPDNVRKSMADMKVDTAYYESAGKLVFVDCYSPLIGLESKEKLYVDSYSLSALSIALSKALAQQERLGTAVILLDSFSPLVQKCGFQPSIEFLRTLVAKVRMFKSACLIKMNRKAFAPPLLASVQDVVDCVIEMKVEEEPEGLGKYLRVSKMKGAKCSTAWTPYEASPETGIVEKVGGSRNGAKGGRGAAEDGLPLYEVE
ncbi:MAG: ATPase domain-containing protein, partial [Thermoproteota archaeon]